MSRLRHLLVLTALPLCLLLWSPPPPAAAQESTDSDRAGVSWTLTPAPDERGQDRVSIRTVLDPGETYTDEVVLTNTGSSATVFLVYAADGLVTSGGFDVLLPGVDSTGAGQWVTTESSEVSLDPGASQTVPLTITVPEDATPGDWPVGVVAAVEQAGQGAGLSVQTRIGVRIHLQVAGDLAPALAISEVATDYRHDWNPVRPGTVTTSFTLTNTGNVRLGGSAIVELSGPAGLTARRSEIATEREILPGASVRVEGVPTEAWPAVRTSGTVRVTPVIVGQDQLTVALPAAQEAPIILWTMPWSQLLVLVLLIAVVLLWRRRRRRSRLSRQQELARARQEGAEAALGQPAARAGLPDAVAPQA